MRQINSFLATTLLLAILLAGCGQSSNENAVADPSEVSSETEVIEFANVQCPIMGGKPNAELTTVYEGLTIGFCCDGCPQKWAALSEHEKAEKFAVVNRESAGSSAEHDGQQETADSEQHNHSS